MNRLLHLLLLGSLALPALVGASAVNTPHVESEIIPEKTSIQPGKSIDVGLRLKIIDHWHTYWQNPGDSGLPTKIKWSLPPGFETGPIHWPYPKPLPLGPLMNFGYDGEVLHMVKLTAANNAKAGDVAEIRGKAEWLVCNDVCIPESADLSLTLPIRSETPAVNAKWAGTFALARQSAPKATDARIGAAVIDGKNLLIEISGLGTSGETPKDVFFFPIADDVIANAGKQVFTPLSEVDKAKLSVPLASPYNTKLNSLNGVLFSSNGWGALHQGKALSIALPLRYAAAPPNAVTTPMVNSSSQMTLAVAIFFALLGGMILNLMPCVFPVLGIKIMSFARHAQGESRLLRAQGLAFLVGVLFSFWVLAGLLFALRSMGEAVGWGFQLQSPIFVTLLALLFFAMALNLLGVFEVGATLQSAASQIQTRPAKSAVTDSFLSGILATVVATPCTAPMMGAAMGYTLSQPPLISMIIFTAIGIGMALPVTTLAFAPNLLKRLPKSGPWMDIFRKAMAFPLFATVAWLAWVLGSQVGNDGVARLLFGLIALSIGAWIFGQLQTGRPFLAVMVVAIIGGASLGIALPSAQPANISATKLDDGWVPFSRQKLAELRAVKKPVFIDFTATWCITCQVNKRVALNREEVVKRFGELGVVRMKADWTLKDAEITETLAEFGRNGVPLYVFYPVTGDAQLLPEVLTTDIVLAAISNSSAAATVAASLRAESAAK